MHLITSKLKSPITLNGKLNNKPYKKQGIGRFKYSWGKYPSDPVRIEDKHFQIMMAEDGSVLKHLLENGDFIEHKIDSIDEETNEDDLKDAVIFAQKELNEAMEAVDNSDDKKEAMKKVKEAKLNLETAKKLLNKFLAKKK